MANSPDHIPSLAGGFGLATLMRHQIYVERARAELEAKALHFNSPGGKHLVSAADIDLNVSPVVLAGLGDPNWPGKYFSHDMVCEHSEEDS